MRRIGIGEVCRLLDIKPHVLRYWEEGIPFLEPEKNVGGRRMYGDRELNILYRLKFLISEKRLTVEGARIALLEEMSGFPENEKAEILALRKNLLDAHGALEDLKEKSSEFTGSSFIPAGQEHLQKIWKTLSTQKRQNLSGDLLRLPGDLFTLLSALHGEEAALPPEAPPALRLVPRAGFGKAEAEAQAYLASGRLALVTVLPDAKTEDLAASLLSLAYALQEGSAPWEAPLWYIFTPPGERLQDRAEGPRGLRTILSREAPFFYDEEKVLFPRQPFFPYIAGISGNAEGAQGLLCVHDDGHIAGYASGMAGVFLALSSPAFMRGLEARGADTLYFLPLNRFSRAFPDRQLLAGHARRQAALSVLCAGGPCRTTGNYIAGAALFASRGFSRHARPGPPLILRAKLADEIEEIPVREVRLALSSFAREALAWGIRED